VVRDDQQPSRAFEGDRDIIACHPGQRRQV
jgi:hypothetical protein